MNTEVKLAAPGAGLPAPELFIAKRLFALKCATGSREGLIAGFKEERAKIISLVDGAPSERRGERVLIPRLRGLEDSSRHWSLWMTLDHLRIVNDRVAGIIVELAHERVPEGILGTADVKPDPEVTGAIESDFGKSCEDFLTRMSELEELKTDARYPHPWFGPMDSFRWLALASVHVSIHRAQIAAVIRGLNL